MKTVEEWENEELLRELLLMEKRSLLWQNSTDRFAS